MSEFGLTPEEYGERVTGSEPKNSPEHKFAPTENPQPERDRRSVGRFAIESIRLIEAVPSVDWDSVRKLAKPSHEYRIGKLVEKYGTFTPAVASAIAHKRDQSIERILPTAEQIRSERPLLQFAHDLLSFIGLGDWLDRTITRQAKERINSQASRIESSVELAATIKKPKQQFLDELQSIYQHLLNPGTKQAERNRLYDTVLSVYGYDMNSEFDPEKHPLLAGIYANFAKNPAMNRSKSVIKAVTPEVIKGLGTFLADQGRERNEPSEDITKTLSRKVAERFASKHLEKVTHKVVETLEQADRALPESGQEFAGDVYGLCEKITQLAGQGYDGQEIAQQLIKGIFKNNKEEI